MTNHTKTIKIVADLYESLSDAESSLTSLQGTSILTRKDLFPPLDNLPVDIYTEKTTIRTYHYKTGPVYIVFCEICINGSDNNLVDSIASTMETITQIKLSSLYNV